MKHLKIFENFNNVQNIEQLCKTYIDSNTANKKRINEGTLSYEINNNIVDVVGTLTLDLENLDEIPFKLGTVNDTIFIKGDILSLKNSPREVKFAFNIGACNNITSLIDGPEYVGGFYHLNSLKIDNFSGIAKPLKTDYTMTTRSYDSWNISNVLRLFLPERERDYFLIDHKAYDDMEWFSYYDPIRGNEIVIDKLNTFLEDIGRNPVKEVKGYKSI